MADQLPPLAQDEAFLAFHEKHLKPLRDVMETHRMAALAERKRRLVAAVAALAAAVALSLLVIPIPEGQLGRLLAGAALLCIIAFLGFWAWLPTLAHKMRLKEQVLPRILSYFGDLSYEPLPDLDLEDYRQAALLPDHTECLAVDQVRGSHHGVPMAVAEVQFKKEVERRDSSGGYSKSTVTVFKGLLCEFTLPRNSATTVAFGSKGSFKGDFKRLTGAERQPVGLDDDAFEAHADDEEAARELLPPVMLRALGRIRKSFAPDGWLGDLQTDPALGELLDGRLFGSFHKDRLLLLIEHKADYFELSSQQETDFIRDAEKTRAELTRIFGIIESLALEPVLAPDERVAGDPLPTAAASIKDSKAGYDVGGWGCLPTFLAFALLLALCSWLLRGFLPDAVVLGVAAAAAALLALAGFSAVTALRKSPRRFPLGALILALLGLLFLLPASPHSLLTHLPGGKTLIDFRIDRLTQAVQRNDRHTVERLLSAGVGTSPAADGGRPLIMEANSVRVLDLMLDSGLEPDARDALGRTALMMVGRPAMADVLLSHGADANAEDRRGNSVLSHVSDPEIEALLLKAGAERTRFISEGE